MLVIADSSYISINVGTTNGTFLMFLTSEYNCLVEGYFSAIKCDTANDYS